MIGFTYVTGRHMEAGRRRRRLYLESAGLLETGAVRHEI